MASYELARGFLFGWEGFPSGDTPLYLAVGRGILNGLVPYRDLFENKPPGIFLLSSLSLWLFNDATLGYVLDAFIIVLLPVLTVIGAWMQLRSSSPLHRWIGLPLAFLFGASLALYAFWRSGGFQVEFYGVFFAALYVVLIGDPRAKIGKLRILSAGLAVLLAAGMKEPFILTMMAAALLLAGSAPSRLWRSVILPFAVAGSIGTGLLFFSGLAGAFGTYLRFQTIIRISSPWMRGLDWMAEFWDLQEYHPLLGIIVFLLIATCLLQLLSKHPVRIAWQILSVCAAGYLIFLAVGMGGQYFNHHYAFAVPGYLALFFAGVREIESRWAHWQRGFLALGSGLVLATSFSMPSLDFAELQWKKDWVSEMQLAAEKIDDILDECDLPTYLSVGGGFEEMYGYTEHSPLGPAFFQSRIWLDPRASYFRETFLENLSRSELIVFTDYRLNDLESLTDDYIRSHFTEKPWKCAKSVEKPPFPYVFFYRKKDGASAPLARAIEQEKQGVSQFFGAPL